jgi:RNA polymerase sigma-70 factor (ECF subfamily)
LDYTALDDNALIRLIVHRRTEALSELYDRYSRLVFSLALHTVGDRETAEEITQDVFFRVWEKADTYHSEQSKLSTWITSITRYRAIDILRKRGSRPEQSSLDWEDVPPASMPIADDNPEGETELAMKHGRIRSAVANLPAEQRQVLALAYFQGLSHSQISEELDQPLGTVKTRIRLAMQKLRETLQDELHDIW